MSHIHTFQVRGMTCGHCAGAVTGEIEALEKVICTGRRPVDLDL